MTTTPSDLVVIDDEHSAIQTVDLLGASPAARLDQARKISELLAPVIREQSLSVDIQGNEHVKFEGWTLLGSLLGVFPVTDWVTEIEHDGEVIGFKARVVARTLGGQIVGAAEARCTRSERQWERRDEFSLASMAQTRAGAKALRMPLGFVMQLAGFSTTPEDEITIDAGPFAELPAKPKAARKTKAAKPKAKAKIVQQTATPPAGGAFVTKLPSAYWAASFRAAEEAYGAKTDENKFDAAKWALKQCGIKHQSEIPEDRLDEVIETMGQFAEVRHFEIGAESHETGTVEGPF